MWAASVIFKKLPRVNNRPLGEISPNLVTLMLSSGQQQRPLVGCCIILLVNH
jgi:hypothetical protein